MAPLSDPINPTIWGDTRGTVQCWQLRESEEKTKMEENKDQGKREEELRKVWVNVESSKKYMAIVKGRKFTARVLRYFACAL